MLGISLSTVKLLATVSVVAGTLLVWRYVIPYRSGSTRYDSVTVDHNDPRKKKDLSRRYTQLGYLGYGLILAGVALSVWAFTPG